MTLLSKIKPYRSVGPGKHVRELMALLKWNVKNLAIEMRMKPEEVNELLDDTLPINQNQAVALESVFGPSGQLWLYLDRKYRDNVKH